MEIGSIIIPKGIKDKESIKNLCFNEEKFFVMTNTRGMIDNVACLHQVVADIEFPKDDNTLGSQVVIEEVKGANQFIIIGTLSKIGESTYKSEENLLYRKTYKGEGDAIGNTVGMSGNTLLSKLAVFCKNVNQKAANLLIECFGNNESKLELRSSGWIFCKGEKGIKLRYKNEKEINILGDQIQIFFSKNQNLTLKDKEFVYKDGKNILKIDNSGYTFGNLEIPTFLTEILDFLGNDAMLLSPMGPTSMGMMSTSAAPKLTKLKQKLQNINK